MILFFTSVGFQSDLRVLRQGGRPLAVMIVLVALLIVVQNLLSLGIARGMRLDPLVGMATGSIPMCGGHGTAGGFSPVLQDLGLANAASVTMAAATFGLVAGSLIGGPLGEWLAQPAGGQDDPIVSLEADGAAAEKRVVSPVSKEQTFRRYAQAICQLLLCVALGMGVSKLLARTGITFPTYFGALLVGALVRNLLGSPRPGRTPPLCTDEIVAIGNICLSLFLGMAMATLKLWELAGLMLPLVVILLVAFPALGRDYDAAVLASGLCGFGLGATPNAMANMSAVCFKYHYAVRPFVIVPILGAMFVDIINTGVITLFLNLIAP